MTIIVRTDQWIHDLQNAADYYRRHYLPNDAAQFEEAAHWFEGEACDFEAVVDVAYERLKQTPKHHPDYDAIRALCDWLDYHAPEAVSDDEARESEEEKCI